MLVLSLLYQCPFPMAIFHWPGNCMNELCEVVIQMKFGISLVVYCVEQTGAGSLAATTADYVTTERPPLLHTTITHL